MPFDMTEKQLARRNDLIARGKGLVLFALLSPIWMIFAHFNQSNRGFVVTCLTGVFCVAAYLRKDANKNRKFQLILGAVFITQLAVALLVPLPETIVGATAIPIAIADYFLVTGILSVFGIKPQNESPAG